MEQKYRQKVLLSVLLFLITILILIGGTFSQEHRINSAVVRLGNPLAADGQRDHALNVWDLQAFQGKIYVAGGSTVTNVGLINV
jgi:hypothetical protein